MKLSTLTPFPTTYRFRPTQELIAAFDAGPYRLRKVVEGLTLTELRAHPKPGKWSISELILHLADAEVLGGTRLRMILGEDQPVLPRYDQELWAVRFQYQKAGQSDVQYALQLFESLRMTASLLFHSACESDWKRTGLHPEWGQMSLRQLLELYADHSERHLGQILELRALLGRPMDMKMLLPERLY